MTERRSHGVAALLVTAGLALTGCATAAQGADGASAEVPASVSTPKDGGPGIVTLSKRAEQRLGIRTVAVATAGSGLVIPYGAVVYEPDGSSWAFVQKEPLTYQRAPVAITAITGDQASLASGPPPGTPVVTQGAAELVGVETGIDGEE